MGMKSPITFFPYLSFPIKKNILLNDLINDGFVHITPAILEIYKRIKQRMINEQEDSSYYPVLGESDLMKKKSIIALLLASLFLLISGAAADTVQVQNVQINTIGTTTPVAITLDTASAGIAGFDINITLSNPSVASITDVTFPPWAILNESSSLSASSVRLRMVDLYNQNQPSSTNVPFGSVTLKGKATGSTDVVITIKEITSDVGDSLSPTLRQGTFTVDAAPLSQPIIANNATTDLSKVPLSWINTAKSNLHIAYGHTSHGSQIYDGMDGLTTFGGAPYGGSIYLFNDGGSGGALDFDDGIPGADDLGNPDRTTWATATRNYLTDHDYVNVIMWSWCGQADTSEENINTYLGLMSDLEEDYPDVKFVYMTGHLVGSGEEGNLHQRNEQIRNYVRTNNKILFDFADIESYDPDGVYYGDLYANDACTYDDNGNHYPEQDDDGFPLNGDQNWAINWQNSHTEGTEWYSCGAAHSQPLNANQKAYAAWWLWARLGGWDGNPITESPKKFGVYRPSTHSFYLDYNGDMAWSGAAIDRQKNFGLTGDLPVSGDWNNDGKSEFGVYRPSTHSFYLDHNGDMVWSGAAIDRQYNFGLSEDIPLSGHW
jgi:hypothetical protein